MLILLSPAKTFYEFEPHELKKYKPLRFVSPTTEIVNYLKDYTAMELKEWMKISEDLAETNFKRYQAFESDQSVGREAMDYFNGEAYKGLDAHSLSDQGRSYLKNNLIILSGLYGCVHGGDIIQAYRLEMGSKMQWAHGKSLYAYWKQPLTDYLITCLNTHQEKVIINLASTEYSKALDMKKIMTIYPVINIQFKQKVSEGKYKVVGMYAKKARGLMTRYIAENNLQDSNQIKSFNLDGYRFDEGLSSNNEWVFVKN